MREGECEDWTGLERVHIHDKKYEIVTQDDMNQWKPPPGPYILEIVICYSKRQREQECLEDDYGHPEYKCKRR